MSPAELLSVAVEAIGLASQLIRTQPVGVLTAKGDRDYASEVDYAIERTVRGFLQERTPRIDFLGEEGGFTGSSQDIWWTLDPIDGTVNLSHGVPLCGVSLALIHESQPVLGVIDLPFLSARYTAVAGQGAFRDSERLHVSGTDRLANALVTIGDYAVGPDAAEANKLRLAVTKLLANQALRVRMIGSAAVDLAWLAEGKTDGSITLSNQSWDVAAGVIVAREAGARVFDIDGSDYTTRSRATIACPPAMYDDLCRILAKAAI